MNFDSAPAGQPPTGWTATKTGTGDAKWTIEKDDTAPSKPNVLKQSGQAHVPVCFKDDTSLKDGFVEVKFKPISGREDQAGGLVWRAKDSNNYYVARANALENNVTIYHTIEGRRTEKKRANVKVAGNQWHTLARRVRRARTSSSSPTAKKALEWDDETFTQAGKVGVWTKADSVTLFDDFSYGDEIASSSSRSLCSPYVWLSVRAPADAPAGAETGPRTVTVYVSTDRRVLGASAARVRAALWREGESGLRHRGNQVHWPRQSAAGREESSAGGRLLVERAGSHARLEVTWRAGAVPVAERQRAFPLRSWILNDFWTGFSARIRVIAYNTKLVTAGACADDRCSIWPIPNGTARSR